jgi:hypothetical protein
MSISIVVAVMSRSSRSPRGAPLRIVVMSIMCMAPTISPLRTKFLIVLLSISLSPMASARDDINMAVLHSILVIVEFPMRGSK